MNPVSFASQRSARDGFTQRQLAAKWKRPQSTVAATETGERRLDVVEFFELAEALEVDPVALFERVARW
jgi:transcriptional regulator with XRE-family HTH domain